MNLNFSDDAVGDGGLAHILNLIKGHAFEVRFTDDPGRVESFILEGADDDGFVSFSATADIVSGDRDFNGTVGIPFRRIASLTYI